MQLKSIDTKFVKCIIHKYLYKCIWLKIYF